MRSEFVAVSVPLLASRDGSSDTRAGILTDFRGRPAAISLQSGAPAGLTWCGADQSPVSEAHRRGRPMTHPGTLVSCRAEYTMLRNSASGP